MSVATSLAHDWLKLAGIFARRLMSKRTLILGVDGGGSKTAASVAEVGVDGEITELGKGFGGPSNVRAVGPAHAEINLEVAIDAAHSAAGTENLEIDYAVLALAGSALPDVHAIITNWARRRNVGRRVDVVPDADPVLAIGALHGKGIALIVGTGSVAIGKDDGGQRSMTGGWGHWFGDTGSGFDLGRRALSAVADAVDGIGPETALVDLVLDRLQTDNPREILQRLSLHHDVRREIASLAPVLLHAAEDGDEIASAIVTDAATSTAKLVSATAKKLGFDSDVPLAIAGGIVCSNTLYRETLLKQLHELGTDPASITLVREPVAGSLLMARDRLMQTLTGV
jgi:N-acetylglucosamine kinase-like BadF-type ATPase